MRSSAPSGFDIREAVESLREAFTPRDSGHKEHRDIRAAILQALAHESMNGHQVIQAIASRSGGMWMPSAGEVYPTLQQLADEGMVSAEHDGERKVYSLTDAGREAAAHAEQEHSHDSAHDSSSREWRMRFGDRSAAVPRAGAKLAQAAAQVTQSGTRAQQERAAAMLDETRKRLYAILAED